MISILNDYGEYELLIDEIAHAKIMTTQFKAKVDQVEEEFVHNQKKSTNYKALGLIMMKNIQEDLVRLGRNLEEALKGLQENIYIHQGDLRSKIINCRQ